MAIIVSIRTCRYVSNVYCINSNDGVPQGTTCKCTLVPHRASYRNKLDELSPYDPILISHWKTLGGKSTDKSTEGRGRVGATAAEKQVEVDRVLVLATRDITRLRIDFDGAFREPMC